MRLLGSPRSQFAGTPIAKIDFSSIWTMFSIWSFTDHWTFYREHMNFKRAVFVRASNCPFFDAQIQQGINSTFQAGLHQVASLNKPSELNSVFTVINKEVYNALILWLLKPSICTYNLLFAILHSTPKQIGYVCQLSWTGRTARWSLSFWTITENE